MNFDILMKEKVINFQIEKDITWTAVSGFIK
jgi:hypothetical protein